MSDIDRVMAERMGYVWHNKLYVKDADGNGIVDGTEWSPSTNIAQAMQCLFKTGLFFTIDNESVLMSENPEMYNGAEELPLAICNAILNVTGGGDA